jgi:hypothetical protein
MIVFEIGRHVANVFGEVLVESFNSVSPSSL